MPDHHDEREPSGFTMAELQDLADAGVIEIVQPGTPEAAAFDREMAEQLANADEDLRQREGPDALTSDRLLRQAAIAAEQEPERVGYAFATWCSSHDWER